MLRPQDRVAVKPHASPVFHAANYLFGPADPWPGWKGCGNSAAPRPIPAASRMAPEVDFSTGSVGLGVAITSFSRA